jgi:preprotein translocase subunit SecE
MGPNKSVHAMFLSGGVLLFFLLQWTADWIWGYFARHPPEFAIQAVALLGALAIGVTMYRNERVYSLANDVASELKKVTWPTWKETKAATLVVIVTVVICATLLFIFDAAWSWLTDRIYG